MVVQSNEAIPQVFQDETLREKMRFFIEGELKKYFWTNRQIDIVVGKDIHKVSSGVSQVEQLDGTYQIAERKFTIAIIDAIKGIPEPITSKIGVYTVSMSFFVDPDNNKDYHKKVKEALEEFEDNLRGKVFADVAKGYRFATNSEEYSSIGLKNLHGTKYVIYTLTVYLLSSTEIFFGNDVTYRIKKFTDDDSKYEIIEPLDRSHSYGVNLNSAQLSTDESSGQSAAQNVWGLTMTLLWVFAKDEAGNPIESILTDIIRLVETSKVGEVSAQNFPFRVEVTWPIIGPIVHDVIIIGSTIIPGLGNGVAISLVLNRAKQTLLDTFIAGTAATITESGD